MFTLPETNIASKHGGFQLESPRFQRSIFSCYVSFREGILQMITIKICVLQNEFVTNYRSCPSTLGDSHKVFYKKQRVT